jgi:hypothetical protein
MENTMSKSLLEEAEAHLEKHFNAAACTEHFTNEWLSFQKLEDHVFSAHVRVDSYALEKPINAGDVIWNVGAKAGVPITWYIFDTENRHDPSDSLDIKIYGVDLSEELKLKP